jgi:hypothetical protein
LEWKKIGYGITYTSSFLERDFDLSDFAARQIHIVCRNVICGFSAVVGMDAALSHPTAANNTQLSSLCSGSKQQPARARSPFPS